MGFQSTVRLQQTTGIVGEVFAESPTRAFPCILKSADPLNNVIGRAFSYVSGEDLGVEAGGTNFAGILVNPLVYANKGVGSESLAPTLVLGDETVAQLLEMGIIFVESATAANINDSVFYDPATGEIATGVASSGSYTEQIVGAKVVRRNTDGAGLCVIQLTATPSNFIPAP
jgi:hypothetical protein